MSTTPTTERPDVSVDQPTSSPEGRIVLPLLAVASVFALAWRLLDLLRSTGGNTPTGDDVWPIKLFLYPAATGEFDWSTLVTAAYNNGQEQALSFLVYYGSVLFTDLNYFSFAWYAVVLGVIRVFLTYDMIVRASGRAPGRLLLLPAIAFLTFSYTQMALYEFDVTAVPFGTGMTMFTLGAWAAIRFPNRWPGVLIGAAAITAGCFAGGIGLVSLPFVVAAFVVWGTRRLRLWLVLGGTVLANVGLFAWLYQRAGSAAIQERGSDTYEFGLLRELVGLVFGPPGYPETGRAGMVGVVLAVLVIVGVPVAIRRGWITMRAGMPAVVLIGFATASILQLYLLRGFSVQYYGYASMYLWIGLLAATYALAVPLLQGQRRFRATRVTASLVASLGVVVLSMVVVQGARANRSFEDDMLFTRWRTVVSESCVRHYRIAPTACEKDLVPWAVARLPEFTKSVAEPLEETALGPFAPSQRWTLQGDWILPLVEVDERAGDVSWVRARREAPESFRSALTLNLLLRPTDEVRWTLAVPEGTIGTFRTSVSAASSTFPGPDADGSRFELRVDDEVERTVRVRPREVRWQDVELDLEPYAGRTITLTLAADPLDDDTADELVLRAPRADVVLTDPETAFADEETDYPSRSARDLDLPVNEPDAWELDDIEVLDDSGETTLWEAAPGVEPRMTLREDVDACVSDFSSLAFRLAVDEPWTANADDLVYEDHALRFFVRFEGQDDFDEVNSLLVPFYYDTFEGREGTTADRVFGDVDSPDNALPMREYTIPMRALAAPRGSRIREIAVAPYQQSMRGVQNRFRFEELRLVAADEPSDACDEADELAEAAEAAAR